MKNSVVQNLVLERCRSPTIVLISSDDNIQCKCKTCFGITHDNLLAIQDAVAFELHKWLDKRLTCNTYDIGLDYKLQKLNDKQIEHRKSLCKYAAHDCDAIFQLILSTGIIYETDPLTEFTRTDEETLSIHVLSPIVDSTDSSPDITINDLIPNATPCSYKI